MDDADVGDDGDLAQDSDAVVGVWVCVCVCFRVSVREEEGCEGRDGRCEGRERGRKGGKHTHTHTHTHLGWEIVEACFPPKALPFSK